VKLAGTRRDLQGPAGVQQMPLADYILQALRPHLLGQRRYRLRSWKQVGGDVCHGG
jgi:hypothetical protein